MGGVIHSDADDRTGTGDRGPHSQLTRAVQHGKPTGVQGASGGVDPVPGQEGAVDVGDDPGQVVGHPPLLVADHDHRSLLPGLTQASELHQGSSRSHEHLI